MMRGSRKFCQMGSNSDSYFFGEGGVDEGRKDPNTTISGTSFRWRALDGPTLNAGLVAL